MTILTSREEFRQLIEFDYERVNEIQALIKQNIDDKKTIIKLYKDLVTAQEKKIKHMLDYKKQFNEDYEPTTIQSESTNSESNPESESIEKESHIESINSEQIYDVNVQQSQNSNHNLVQTKANNHSNSPNKSWVKRSPQRNQKRQLRNTYQDDEISSKAVSYELYYPATDPTPT